VPLALRAADLDRDGRPELVTVQSYDTSYGVLGRFDREYGRFAFARSEYAGQAPVALELFDFDGDALLDLVVANRDAQCLSLLPGSGLAKDDKSSFYAAQRLPSGNNPLSVAAGDLDGDGVPDAALANGSAGTVTVFLNRFGLLGERRDLEVGPSPTAVRIADLDGDGHEDLLVLLRPAGGARLAVLHGRGGGEFEAVRSVELGSDVAQLAAVDLQGDGGADWVAVDPLGGRLLVLDVPRPAAAGFVPEPRILAQVPRPAAVTAVIGAGGRQELAVAQDDGRPGVVLYRLQGEALVEVLRAPAEGAAVDLTSGDFDGDGRADLALLARRAAGEPYGFVQLYLRREAGLEPGAREEVGLAAAELVAGDVDGDGRDDFAIGSWGSMDNGPSAGAVTLYSGQDFSQLRRYPGAEASDHFGAAVTAAPDLDGDGVPDLVGGAPYALDLAGERELGEVRAYSGASGELLWVRLGALEEGEFGRALTTLPDLDGDGVAEILVGAPLELDARGATYLLSGADGTLLERRLGLPSFPGTGYYGSSMAPVGDLDGDGRVDWAVGAPVLSTQEFLAGGLFAYGAGGLGAGGGTVQLTGGAEGELVSLAVLYAVPTAAEGADEWAQAIPLWTGPAPARGAAPAPRLALGDRERAALDGYTLRWVAAEAAGHLQRSNAYRVRRGPVWVGP
jgi:hypothetical protein